MAISGPIIRSLRQQEVPVDLFVKTTLPEAMVREFVGDDIPIIAGLGEVTPILLNAMNTDLEATAAALHELDRHFDELVFQERIFITELKADLVVSNVSYIALAASQAA
ncbi:MAG: hypothetical protein O9272_02050, partial [Brevundimonas sp.]|nr:hypothetical protein [Brevundimonas sp.]